MNDPFFNLLNYDPFAPPSQQNQRGGVSQHQQQHQQLAMRDPFASHMMMMQNAMSPFGAGGGVRSANNNNPFSMMNSMMGNMHRMIEAPFANVQQNVHHAVPNQSQVYSSSSVVTYSNTGDGQPKIYQASQQVRQGPDGVKETRKFERDSERGLERVAVGHHIGERAHVIERQKMNGGQLEETVNLENLDDNDLPEFNREFEQKVASNLRHAHRSNQHHHHIGSSHQPFAAIDHDGSSARSSSKKDSSSKKSKSSSKSKQQQQQPPQQQNQ